MGVLYGLSGDTLGTINVGSGVFSSVGTLSLDAGYALQAIAFSPGGTLYDITRNSIGGDQQLITLDTATAATLSNLGSLKGQLYAQDMTFAADGNIYAANYSYHLVLIDPQSLVQTDLGFGAIGALGGIASLPTTAPTPEPSGVVLICTGLVGLAGAVRRKLRR